MPALYEVHSRTLSILSEQTCPCVIWTGSRKSIASGSVGIIITQDNLVLPLLATEFHSSAFPNYILLFVSHHNKVFENLLNV